jgi:hypothetical protein
MMHILHVRRLRVYAYHSRVYLMGGNLVSLSLRALELYLHCALSVSVGDTLGSIASPFFGD